MPTSTQRADDLWNIQISWGHDIFQQYQPFPVCFVTHLFLYHLDAYHFCNHDTRHTNTLNELPKNLYPY